MIKMAECKKCGDWISLRQNEYHKGMCVNHAEYDMEYIYKQKQMIKKIK